MNTSLVSCMDYNVHVWCTMSWVWLSAICNVQFGLCKTHAASSLWSKICHKHTVTPASARCTAQNVKASDRVGAVRVLRLDRRRTARRHRNNEIAVSLQILGCYNFSTSWKLGQNSNFPSLIITRRVWSGTRYIRNGQTVPCWPKAQSEWGWSLFYP